MKLYEITNINNTNQLDEGLKQTLAALLLTAIAGAAHGQPIEDTVQKMSPEVKAAVAQNMTAATQDREFRTILQAKAASAGPEVQQAVASGNTLKRFAQELQALATDPDQMMTTKLGGKSRLARQGDEVRGMATDPDQMMTGRFK